MTLDGPNVTVAFESGLEMVPPAVGETMVGGERPLAVFAVGSGIVVVPAGGVVVPEPVADWPLVDPTTTETVPLPEVVPEAGGLVTVEGSGGGVVDVAPSPVVVEEVVAGAEPVVPVPVVPTVVLLPVEAFVPVEPLVSVVVVGGVTVVLPG